MSDAAVLLIGLGNPLAGDDGVGGFVIEALRDRVGSGTAELMTCPAPGPEMIDLLDGDREVWFIDAAKDGGRAPGVIVHQRIAPDETPPLETAKHMVSTHGFSMSELLRLATTLRRRRATIELWAVVGERFDAGSGLSSAVEAAAEGMVGRMAERLRNGIQNQTDALR